MIDFKYLISLLSGLILMNDYEIEKARLEAADRLGLAFARTVILLNGGAFVVLLAYLGSSSTESIFLIPLEGLRRAMYGFLSAILCMLVALFASYIRYAIPFDFKTGEWLGRNIVRINSTCAVLSIIGFTYGVWILIQMAKTTSV